MNPRRTYAEGLELFKAHASRQIVERHLAYLAAKPYPTRATDRRWVILTAKLRGITLPMGREVAAQEQPKTARTEDVKEAVQRTVPPAAMSERHVETRLKIVKYADLPQIIRDRYDAIRELMPLRTQLKAELAAARTDENRKDIAVRLCDIDDKMRNLWDAIDNWDGGRLEDAAQPERPTYDGNTFVAALQVAKRRKQLGDNIRTTKMSIARYAKEGRQELLERAQSRLERYERERDQLEMHIADAERSR